MRKIRICCVMALLLMVPFFRISADAEATGFDYAVLTRSELEGLQQDIKNAIKEYHEPKSAGEDAVRTAVKETVEAYYEEQNYSVEWPWLDYDYTRDWDYYSIKTHVDYKNKENKKDKGKLDVYAEYLINEDGLPELGYLTLGETVLEDNRSKLPKEKWSGNVPTGLVNKATKRDLAAIDRNDLEDMSQKIEDEIEKNHTPDNIITDLVLSLTKYLVVNAYNSVDWPEASFFGGDPFTYTCDWGFYTLDTHISYKDADDKKQKADIYAEVYYGEEVYRIYFLTVGDDILVDHRKELPLSLSKVASQTGSEKTVTEDITEELEKISEAIDVEQGTERISEQITIAVESQTETESARETEVQTEKQTEEMDPVLYEKGDSGDEIKTAQTKLIALGMLEGYADGIYGEKTKSAVAKYQSLKHLVETGTITQKTWDKLSKERIPERETQAPQTEARQPETQPQTERMVWVSNSGSKWHRNSGCSNMRNPSQISMSSAEAMGLSPCKRCN